MKTFSLFVLFSIVACYSHSFPHRTQIIDGKKYYLYEMCIALKATPPSITSNRLVGIADTVMAHVFGRIEPSFSECRIQFMNLGSARENSCDIDTSGYYSIWLAEGTYRLASAATGFESMTIDSLYLGSGYLREIDFDLGSWAASVLFDYRSEKKLSPDELREISRSLSK